MLTWKPSCSAAATTRFLVSGRSWPRPFNAFETVPGETPASAATSLTVTTLPRRFRCATPAA
jgi:hypothetical protein